MNITPTIAFIREHAQDDVRRLALQKNRYPEVDIDFALQQIEGRQLTRTKLPEIHQIEDWYYPVRLSLEQCSSEVTARYKAQLLAQAPLLSPLGGKISPCSESFPKGELEGARGTLVDLTGGFGIDTFYLSENFETTHYVERNAELCEIAEHNFGLTGRNIVVHNAQAECVLRDAECGVGEVDVIYLDPARRSASGGKVFRLQDCEPDLTVLYPLLMSKCKVLMVKLSPMLDITEALRYLPDAKEVHIVAVKNEVKEILIVAKAPFLFPHEGERCHAGVKRIAVNLETDDKPFIFTTEEETQCSEFSPKGELEGAGGLLYEPNAAILKAGAFRSVGARYGLSKLAVNTHLYASDKLIEDFPGRVFKVLGTPDKAQLKALQKTGAHTICRNYPLSADKLAAKHKIKEGGTLYIIGTRIGDKPILLLVERVR